MMTMKDVFLKSEKLMQETEVTLTTVACLLALKLNVNEDCFSFKPPKAMFKINKSADMQYNDGYGSYSNYIESDEFYDIVIDSFCARIPLQG